MSGFFNTHVSSLALGFLNKSLCTIATLLLGIWKRVTVVALFEGWRQIGEMETEWGNGDRVGKWRQSGIMGEGSISVRNQYRKQSTVHRSKDSEYRSRTVIYSVCYNLYCLIHRYLHISVYTQIAYAQPEVTSIYRYCDGHLLLTTLHIMYIITCFY